MISVVQLGTLDYATGLRIQQQLVDLRKEGRIGDVLLLLEHAPVITLGRNAKQKNVLLSHEELDRRGVELFETDRGGDVTFHGPGQLVGYPIFDLHGFPSKAGTSTLKYLGAVDYVRRIEEVLIRTCLDFKIPTKRVPGLTGVWTDWASKPEAQPEAKIAAIGVHISRSVTSHGFALNVNTDLSYFNLIVPCGIENKPVTSLAEELGEEDRHGFSSAGHHAQLRTSVRPADPLGRYAGRPAGSQGGRANERTRRATQDARHG